MATPSVKAQEKQRMLMDQNAKNVAQYVKERSNLEREMSYYHNFEVFLDTKTAARHDHRKGDYYLMLWTQISFGTYFPVNKLWCAVEGIKLLFNSF